MKKLIALSYLLLSLLPLLAQQQDNHATNYPAVEIKVERLPDLSMPRHGHVSLCVNGEAMVIGGHTTNFVPIPTAEYYKDGAWHVVPLAYCHDDGSAVELSTGKVLIIGGHEKELGIGQTYTAELYDPITHTSEGFASIDTKRSLASALALDSGRAIIVGNWHHADAIEMYDGKNSFVRVKEVTQGRCVPFILRTAKDNAIIFAERDTMCHAILRPVADRLHGDTLHIPLLEEWKLVQSNLVMPSQKAFIGDEAKGDYSYLLMVKNDQGQLAIARTSGEEFSLLPTDVPIPMSYKWGDISYVYFVLADRQSKRAYIIGADAWRNGKPINPIHVYVVTIDYSTVPAHLTLGYTDALNDCDVNNPILTEDGNLILTGGAPTNNNFQPTASTWLLHISPKEQAAGLPLWGWGIAILAAIALSALLIWLVRRGRNHKQETATHPGVEVDNREPADEGEKEPELIERICQMMEEKQLYLNNDLKVADIADALNISQRVVSDCINTHRGTFRQFVNTYRVAYAQQLLQNQSDITITEVWMSAGFSSESSFFRIFKAATGLTPRDWKQNFN